MTRFAYAVLYDTTGRVFVGRKNTTGHFFHKFGRGSVSPRGEPLAGGGGLALPGGPVYPDEDVAVATFRGFHDDTGELIGAGVRFDEATWPAGLGVTYSAGFIRVGAAQLNAIGKRIVSRRLPAGLAAREAIVARRIRMYSQIRANFPEAPPVNELATGGTVNVLEPADWSRIARWYKDVDQGWYHEILRYLRDEVVRAPDPEPLRVRIGVSTAV